MAERPRQKRELDFTDKVIAAQRRNAAALPTRPRARPPPSEAPPDVEDFSRLRISSPSRSKPHGKLFNPDMDPIPLRRAADVDANSDHNSSGPARSHPRSPHLHPSAAATPGRQLFDPSRHDPLRFSKDQPQLKMRPSRGSLADWVSVSSASVSSSTPSVLSSVFTLTSNATSSSASSPHNKTEDTSNSWLTQLKKLYRDLSAMEVKLQKEVHDDETKVQLKSRTGMPEDKTLRMIADHKGFAEICHTFLNLTLSPLVPASVNGLANKCNIAPRLWTTAFQLPLEVLRRASINSPIAQEHLSEFTYYAYGFYTVLLEERLFESFKPQWLEALGDLARYRMALAAHLASNLPGHEGNAVSTLSVPLPAPRIDDSPSPSIGAGAVQNFELEPEREHWRTVARGWFGEGLRDTPGTGKLHHHLGLLCRNDGEDETLRALYHFVKSMTTSHPFSMSRESILTLFSPVAQAKRALPEATTEELFVLLHGMLFTHIQLDDFEPTLARFLEKLQLEGVQERAWIMMGVTNLGALLDYGRSGGVLRGIGALGEKKESISKPAAKRSSIHEGQLNGDKKMDEDEPEDNETPQGQNSQEDASVPMTFEYDEVPIGFTLSMRLTFAMFSHALRNPKRKISPFSPSVLNPYITILLTFLSNILKHPRALSLMERAMPWDDLAAFLNTIPRSVLTAELEAGAKLTSGSDPLPEDWCMRGMEWVGRRVYERGFWARDTKGTSEMDVLLAQEAAAPADDGIIEDDSDEQQRVSTDHASAVRRWTRICRSAGALTRSVDGFHWERTARKWSVGGALKTRVVMWQMEDQRQAEESQRRQSRWADEDEMDVDEHDAEEESESSGDDADDSEQVKALRARRRYLRSLIQPGNRANGSTGRKRSHTAIQRPRLRLVPGYTVLVFDTNILLSSLPSFSSLVESLRWTIVVPLAVITELDGLSSNPAPLGEAARAALTYITARLRTHGASLKVQTSKGNFLASLTVRSEQVTFAAGEGAWERNMDDLILRASIWQLEHWVDRSVLLPGVGAAAMDVAGASKVVLMTFDRNLRLKSRSRHLDAADEQDMATVLSPGP